MRVLGTSIIHDCIAKQQHGPLECHKAPNRSNVEGFHQWFLLCMDTTERKHSVVPVKHAPVQVHVSTSVASHPELRHLGVKGVHLPVVE